MAIVNRQAALGQGVLLVDGQAYHVGEIPLGESRFPLHGGLLTESMSLEGDVAPLFQALLEEFPLDRGLWLVGFRERPKGRCATLAWKKK